MEKFDRILDIYADWAYDIFGVDIEVQWGASFGCYPEAILENSCIEIGMTAAEDHVKDLPAFFSAHFSQNYNMSDVEYYTLCFAHELGHLATRYLLTDEEAAIQAAGRVNKDITLDEYRALPGEFKADQWANDYLNTGDWNIWQIKLRNAYADVTEADLIQFARGEE